MVASIAGAPPGSTVVRRAETLSNSGDGRSGNRSRREPADQDDSLPKDSSDPERHYGGVISAPPGGLTVEGLLTLQEQPEDEREAGTAAGGGRPTAHPRAPY